MSAPSYSDSKEKLIEDVRASDPTSRQFETAKAILEVKGQEEVEKQTKSLRNATWVLAFSTFGLVVATIALVCVSFKCK